MKKALNQLEEGIIALLLVAMTLIVFMDVVMRFGFGTGFLWSQEATLNLAAWFVLFGISYGLKVGAHIGVDAVVKLFPPAIQRVLAIIAVLACLAYCVMFLYGGFIYLQKMYSIGISMEDIHFPQWFANLFSDDMAEVLALDKEDPAVPYWLSQSILVIGLLMFSYRLLQMLFAVIRGESQGFRHVDEAEESMHLAASLKDDEGVIK